MITTFRFILFYLLILLTWTCTHLSPSASVPIAKPLSEFPPVLRDWRTTSQTRFSDDIISALKPTDYLSRGYEDSSGKRIGLYIGYHDGGKDSGEIHSPRNCLPGNGWQQESTERMQLKEPLGTISLVKSVYRKGESREMFFYWFQMQGKTMTDEYSLKLAGIISSIVHGRKDAAFIRFSIPFEADEQEAATAGIRFIRDVYPLIRDFIPA